MGKQIEQMSKEEVKMVNKHMKRCFIPSHKRNANQNYIEIPSHFSQNG
jgi:hypothetical protein